jgi:osmotically-inducible protein OsmY
MYQITIKVNGEEVYLTGYPSEIISEVILTMLKTLKGVEEIKNALIEIKK